MLEAMANCKCKLPCYRQGKKILHNSAFQNPEVGHCSLSLSLSLLFQLFSPLPLKLINCNHHRRCLFASHCHYHFLCRWHCFRFKILAWCVIVIVIALNSRFLLGVSLSFTLPLSLPLSLKLPRSLLSNQDSCSECRCNNGEIVCKKKACPTAPTYPSKSS